MPIQFRCAFCNQLLGIARRKAGTVINCPTCNGRVIVPRLRDGEEVATSGPAERADDLLERSDFDALFQPPAPGKSAARPSAGAVPAAPSLAFSEPGARALTQGTVAPGLAEDPTGRPQAQSKRPGMHLSPIAIVWLLVLGICLLIISFLAGCLVGRFVWVRPTPPKAEEEVTWRWRGMEAS